MDRLLPPAHGLAFLVFLCALAASACCAEVEPEVWVCEGRWAYGPRSVEPTPEKQFEKAQRLEQLGDCRQAALQYERLATVFPGADYVQDQKGEQHNYSEESLLRAARNYLAAGKLIAAREQLDELRRRYAKPGYLDLMGQVETSLGRAFLEGRGEAGTFQVASRVRKARRTFEHILEEDPQGRWPDDAVLGLGQCAEALADYDGAIKKYKELLEKYPESDLRAEAESHIAASLNKRDPLPRYTEAEAQEAHQRIVRRREEAQAGDTNVDLAALAESEKVLLNRQAQKFYMQAGFYVLNGHYRAGEVYYELIKTQFPDTDWARKADEELVKLRHR